MEYFLRASCIFLSFSLFFCLFYLCHITLIKCCKGQKSQITVWGCSSDWVVFVFVFFIMSVFCLLRSLKCFKCHKSLSGNVFNNGGHSVSRWQGRLELSILRLCLGGGKNQSTETTNEQCSCVRFDSLLIDESWMITFIALYCSHIKYYTLSSNIQTKV